MQIHAAHGFLLSQFLSPLLNKREDAYGGSMQNQMRPVLVVLEAAQKAVGPEYLVGLKLNATDQLECGFAENQSLEVIAAQAEYEGRDEARRRIWNSRLS